MGLQLWITFNHVLYKKKYNENDERNFSNTYNRRKRLVI